MYLSKPTVYGFLYLTCSGFFTYFITFMNLGSRFSRFANFSAAVIQFTYPSKYITPFAELAIELQSIELNGDFD